jgi:phosphoesterase RecJ-like protein
MIWNELNEIIEKSDSFLISSHENPDGDSICSQLAIWRYLKNIGKEVEIYNKDKMPEKFRFLSDCDAASNISPNRKFTALIILDCSNPKRTMIENIETEFADKIINIDHHRDNSMFGNVNCVDTTSAATCKILYDFFIENKKNINSDIANYLLAGIMTDSGGFQFNNDDGALYTVASDLVKRGADSRTIFKKLFASHSIAALKIRAKIWETLKFYADNKISVISMPKKLIEEHGEDNSATDGMTNAVLSGESIEVGIFVRYDEKEVHFSLRSSGKVDVGEIAATCDVGGGHKFAAGCTMKNISHEKAIELLIQKITEKL